MKTIISVVLACVLLFVFAACVNEPILPTINLSFDFDSIIISDENLGPVSVSVGGNARGTFEVIAPPQLPYTVIEVDVNQEDGTFTLIGNRSATIAGRFNFTVTRENISVYLPVTVNLTEELSIGLSDNKIKIDNDNAEAGVAVTVTGSASGLISVTRGNLPQAVLFSVDQETGIITFTAEPPYREDLIGEFTVTIHRQGYEIELDVDVDLIWKNILILHPSSITINHARITQTVSAFGNAVGNIVVVDRTSLPNEVEITFDQTEGTITFTGNRPANGQQAIVPGNVTIIIERGDAIEHFPIYVNLQPLPRVEQSYSGMMMSWIPAGTFLMGSPLDEPERLPNEVQREVTLTQNFWMGTTTVTRGQWRALGIPDLRDSWYNEPWPAGGDDLPVNYASWFHAIMFANLLSIDAGLIPAYEIETATGVWSTDPADWGDIPFGHGINAENLARWNAVRIADGSTGYRLPTEAQWERAGRALTTTAFNDGITNHFLDSIAIQLLAWLRAPGVQPVGQLLPNAWGLYDIHGNVMEWVWDRNSVPSPVPATDPTGPADTTQPSRVVKGGSFRCMGFDLRSATRLATNQTWTNIGLGFRLMRPCFEN